MELRRGFTEPLDLLEGEVAALVQFIPVKAGAALGIARRGDEQKQRFQLLGTKDSPGVMEIGKPHRSIIGVGRRPLTGLATMVAMYSAKVLDHFEHPRNAGELEGATASAQVENPGCGDVMQLALRMEGDRIDQVRYRAKGCVPAIACGSALTEMISGKTIDDARKLRHIELVMALGGLPTASLHASHLAIDVLAKALNQLPAAKR